MRYFAGTGLGATLFPGVLWAKVAAGADLTPATVAAAEEVAGLHFEPPERELLLDGLKRQEQQIEALHALPLDNAVALAVGFDPLGALEPDARAALRTHRAAISARAPGRTTDTPSHVTAVPRDADLAFQPVTVLAELLRTRRVTSAQLTRLYLDRIKHLRPGPQERHHVHRGPRAPPRGRRRRRDRAAATADRCTASRGGPRTCSRRAATRPPGAPAPTATR